VKLLPKSRKRCAFSLKDLRVLLALLLVVLGMLVPALSRAQQARNRASSQNNLKQIVQATINTADGQNGKMPPGLEGYYPHSSLVPGTGYGPCLFHILPNMIQAPLYRSAMRTAIYAAWEVQGHPVRTFIAQEDPTSDASSDRTSYLANSLAMSSPSSRTIMLFPASFTDGTSQTIFYAECYSQTTDPFAQDGKNYSWETARRWWDNPVWKPVPGHTVFQLAPSIRGARSTLPQGFSVAGIQVALGDGSIRNISAEVSSATFYAACTPAGGEVLGHDW
jgi:type II secretory pathway pseudopilin PulG